RGGVVRQGLDMCHHLAFGGRISLCFQKRSASQWPASARRCVMKFFEMDTAPPVTGRVVLPIGESMTERIDLASTQSDRNPPPLEKGEGEGWTVTDGRVSQEGRPSAHFLPDGVEAVTYNNPFAQGIERVWYDGKIVYALDLGEVEMPEAGNV